MKFINAEHLKLALVARKAQDQSRWAAISNGAHTRRCNTTDGMWRVTHSPMFVPMDRGYVRRVIETVRMYGADELRATFGTGIKALRTETASHVMRAEAATVREGVAC